MREGEVKRFKGAHRLVELPAQGIEDLVVLGFGASNLRKELRLLLLELVSEQGKLREGIYKLA